MYLNYIMYLYISKFLPYSIVSVWKIYLAFTFVAVLSACNHAGLVDVGVQYFYTMHKDYGVAGKEDQGFKMF